LSIGYATIRTSAAGAIIFGAAARRLAAQAGVLDDASAVAGLDERAFTKRAGELIDSSLAATLMAFLSVEAAVNELLLAHQLGTSANMPGLDGRLAERLSQAWDAGASKLSALEKANLANVIAGCGLIDWSKGPPQKIALLVELRNELVHHKPIWVEHGSGGPESPDKLERKLCSEFKPATIWEGCGGRAPFRWNGCLGAGCAQWASTAADAFNRQLYTTLGMQFPMLDPSL
jgi:hypothetical protein